MSNAKRASSDPLEQDETTLCKGMRVVELGTGIGAAYAGWLFARMGAEVICLVLPDAELMERPTSDRVLPSMASRFIHLDSGKQRWLLGPRSGATDPALGALIAVSDLLVIDWEEPLSARLGQTLDQLRIQHPRLIVATTSCLIQGANAESVPGTGLNAQAVSAVIWAIGEPDRPPLPMPPGILECQAGVNLAAAALLASMARLADGKGQRVDVALSHVLAYYTQGNALGLVPHRLRWHRAGSRCYGSGGSYPYALLPCKDGFMCLICRSRDEWKRLIEAMGSPEWSTQARYQDLRAMGTQYPQEVDDLLKPWLLGLTQAQLLQISLDKAIPMAPVRSMREVLTTPQFLARGFFEQLVLPEAEVTAPGLPFIVSEKRSERLRLARRFEPEPDIASAACAAQVTKRWSNGGAALPPRNAQGMGSGQSSPGAFRDAARPLAGIRVLDLGWVWSAPLAAGILSEFGAEVIKIEHSARLDSMRMRGRPIRDGVPVEGPSIELGPSFHQINHNKRGITLDLKDQRARALVRLLVERSDVLIENMSPGALERLGLGYEELKAINPKLVMLSMSAAGQFGPSAGMRAYAPVMSSFVGMEAMIGYPGESVLGALNFGLGDPNAATHGLVAVFAALLRREATGKGCFIDLSQIEALLVCLAGPMIEASRLGIAPPILGARHPDMAPHGVFPAAGHDRWLTIVIGNEAQWRSLCQVATGEAWCTDSRFASMAARLEHVLELEQLIGVWSAAHERDALCALLRRNGVSSWPVYGIEETYTDKDLERRDPVRQVVHPISGNETHTVAPWLFENIRATIQSSSPMLGEHNREVLCDTLGMDLAEFEELVAAGVIR